MDDVAKVHFSTYFPIKKPLPTTGAKIAIIWEKQLTDKFEQKRKAKENITWQLSQDQNPKIKFEQVLLPARMFSFVIFYNFSALILLRMLNKSPT